MNIAIHRKFQTRRIAEDSTRLYGEVMQHRMRLLVDGYNGSRVGQGDGIPLRCGMAPILSSRRVGAGVELPSFFLGVSGGCCSCAASG